jgi:hypothetical protein
MHAASSLMMLDRLTRLRSSGVLSASALGSVVVLAAGCGAAGSNTSAASTPVAGYQTATGQSHSLIARNRRAQAGRHRSQAGPERDVVHRSGEVVIAHGHSAEPSGGVHPLNPCTLVSAGAVAAIIGQPIEKTVEAPLGPTCIYEPRIARHAGKRHADNIEVTVAVNTMSFKKATAQLTRGITSKLGRHQVFCGVAGHPITFVALTGSQVMTVTGPCPLAAKVAQKALARLPGA